LGALGGGRLRGCFGRSECEPGDVPSRGEFDQYLVAGSLIRVVLFQALPKPAGIHTHDVVGLGIESAPPVEDRGPQCGFRKIPDAVLKRGVHGVFQEPPLPLGAGEWAGSENTLQLRPYEICRWWPARRFHSKDDIETRNPPSNGMVLLRNWKRGYSPVGRSPYTVDLTHEEIT
jgi:hypothetical protein